MRKLILPLVLLLVAGCGQAQGNQAGGRNDVPKDALGFVAHAGGVEFPGAMTDWVPENVGVKALAR